MAQVERDFVKFEWMRGEGFEKYLLKYFFPTLVEEFHAHL